jgi:hypothetical protein
VHPDSALSFLLGLDGMWWDCWGVQANIRATYHQLGHLKVGWHCGGWLCELGTKKVL